MQNGPSNGSHRHRHTIGININDGREQGEEIPIFRIQHCCSKLYIKRMKETNTKNAKQNKIESNE